MSVASNTLYTQHILLTAKSATQWAADNPILLAGELCIESDTNKIKLGNGSSNWNNLPYIDDNVAALIVALEQRTAALEFQLVQFEALADALHTYYNALARKLTREES